MQKKIALYGGIVILLLLCVLGYVQYLRKVAYTNTTNEFTKMQQDVAALQEKRKASDPTVLQPTYLACGCGCCGGTEPATQCPYRSKGDDLEVVKRMDIEASQNPSCVVMGCSLGVRYVYCDAGGQDPTAGWKTYTNEKYGFEFKYPKDVWIENAEGDEYFEFCNEVSCGLSRVPFIIKAVVSDDLVEATKNFNYSLAGRGPYAEGAITVKNVIKTPIKFGDYSGQRAIDVNPQSGLVWYQVVHSQTLFSFVEYSPELTEIILSTFKFISARPAVSSSPVACSMEAKLCPDGSAVGRTGPNCEFARCPSGADGAFCGGIAGLPCPAGYFCKLDGTYPDAGGTCVSIP